MKYLQIVCIHSYENVTGNRLRLIIAKDSVLWNIIGGWLYAVENLT